MAAGSRTAVHSEFFFFIWNLLGILCLNDIEIGINWVRLELIGFKIGIWVG